MELKRGQNGFTSCDICGARRSSGNSFSMVASHSGCQVSSSPKFAFCSAIGVEGAGLSSGVVAAIRVAAAASDALRSLRTAASPTANTPTSKLIAIRNVVGICTLGKNLQQSEMRIRQSELKPQPLLACKSYGFSSSRRRISLFLFIVGNVLHHLVVPRSSGNRNRHHCAGVLLLEEWHEWLEQK